MISVSQDFKKAIKSRERYIKGYVQIINSKLPLILMLLLKQHIHKHIQV